MTVTCTMESATLKRHIVNLAKRVAKNLEHTLAMECVRHANVHQDTSYIKKLLVALLGPSGRKQAGVTMGSWFTTNFPVVIKKTDDGMLSVTLKKNRVETDWQFDTAQAHPYDELTKAQVEQQLYGIENVLEELLKMATKEDSKAYKIDPVAHTFAKEVLVFASERSVELGLTAPTADTATT